MSSITENESKLLVLSYIKCISDEKNERICRPLNITVNFQTSTTLGKLLVHQNKQHQWRIRKKLYTAYMVDCNSVYVGKWQKFRKND